MTAGELAPLNWDRLADRAAAAARAEVDWLRQPENRAFMAGSFMGGFLASSRHLRLPHALVLGVICGYGAQYAYRACEHLETIARASGENPA